MSARRAWIGRASGALVFAALAASSGAVLGCSRAETTGATKEPGEAAFVVTDDAKGLLFTWIDEKGEFHVEEGPAGVPLTQREHVRVLDPTRQDPPGQIHVVDLRTKRPDGGYTVTLVSRTTFDAVAASRRAPVKVAQTSGAGEGPTATAGGARAEATKKVVVVYGASWCGACQKTRAYLKNKGIAFVDKDIDNDSSAAREMRAKLAKAGIQGQGIPVIDVGGELMMGFDPNAIERALSKGS